MLTHFYPRSWPVFERLILNLGFWSGTALHSWVSRRHLWLCLYECPPGLDASARRINLPLGFTQSLSLQFALHCTSGNRTQDWQGSCEVPAGLELTSASRQWAQSALSNPRQPVTTPPRASMGRSRHPASRARHFLMVVNQQHIDQFWPIFPDEVQFVIQQQLQLQSIVCWRFMSRSCYPLVI